MLQEEKLLMAYVSANQTWDTIENFTLFYVLLEVFLINSTHCILTKFHKFWKAHN